MVAGGGGGGGYSGPSAHEKKQAAQLMQSTETLMKFGFMSMSMTYFSSLNMVRAMRTVAAQDTVMAAVAGSNDVKSGASGGGGGGFSINPNAADTEDSGVQPFTPDLQPGRMPGDQDLSVQSWTVSDVVKWLGSLSLGQYREAFKDGAIDGAFLYALNDDDLKNTLGVEHRLHRKKILYSIEEMKKSEAVREKNVILSTMAAEAKAFNSGMVQDYRGNIVGGGPTNIPGGVMIPYGHSGPPGTKRQEGRSDARNARKRRRKEEKKTNNFFRRRRSWRPWSSWRRRVRRRQSRAEFARAYIVGKTSKVRNACERSERAVRTPAGATTRHFDFFDFFFGSLFELPQGLSHCIFKSHASRRQASRSDAIFM